MRIFTIGEAWGPLTCEQFGCCRSGAFKILLSDRENGTLPELNGSKAMQFILDNQLGTVLCDECVEKY
jgi:hypothetical protein